MVMKLGILHSLIMLALSPQATSGFDYALPLAVKRNRFQLATAPRPKEGSRM